MGDFQAALPGCFAHLGGVAERAVCDNDASIVAGRHGGRARLHPEVAALFGALRTASVVLRRTGARVADRWDVERRALHPLPTTDLRLEPRVGRDAFARVCGVDYSVPPAFVGRRVAERVSPTEVRLSCEGTPIAVHRRSFVPADVVLSPEHGRAIRLAREARDRLGAGDVALPPVDLARYDALTGVTP